MDYFFYWLWWPRRIWLEQLINKKGSGNLWMEDSLKKRFLAMRWTPLKGIKGQSLMVKTLKTKEKEWTLNEAMIEQAYLFVDSEHHFGKTVTGENILRVWRKELYQESFQFLIKTDVSREMRCYRMGHSHLALVLLIWWEQTFWLLLLGKFSVYCQQLLPQERNRR